MCATYRFVNIRAYFGVDYHQQDPHQSGAQSQRAEAFLVLYQKLSVYQPAQVVSLHVSYPLPQGRQRHWNFWGVRAVSIYQLVAADAVHLAWQAAVRQLHLQGAHQTSAVPSAALSWSCSVLPSRGRHSPAGELRMGPSPVCCSLELRSHRNAWSPLWCWRQPGDAPLHTLMTSAHSSRPRALICSLFQDRALARAGALEDVSFVRDVFSRFPTPLYTITQRAANFFHNQLQRVFFWLTDTKHIVIFKWKENVFEDKTFSRGVCLFLVLFILQETHQTAGNKIGRILKSGD